MLPRSPGAKLIGTASTSALSGRTRTSTSSRRDAAGFADFILHDQVQRSVKVARGGGRGEPGTAVGDGQHGVGLPCTIARHPAGEPMTDGWCSPQEQLAKQRFEARAEQARD